MVRDSLNNRAGAFRRHPRAARNSNPPPGTSRPGRPLPIRPLNELPEILGGERECVHDETTWRSSLDHSGGCSRKVGRLENGCCVLQVGRDTQLLEFYKHLVDKPHKPFGAFGTWVGARDVLGSVPKATISMSNPDFLTYTKVVRRMQSCGTSIEVMVDHTVQGGVMPFKFTNLFLGETTYIGRVGRSDESQSVGRVVMDVSKFEEEINHSQYDDPPVHRLQGHAFNPVLTVSLVNITPIVPLALDGVSYGRRAFFLHSPMQFKDLVALKNRSGRSISPSRFKFELGKDFQNYFEYIPDGYERLLPESIEEARELASETKHSTDHERIELHLSADSVQLRYGFQDWHLGSLYEYDVTVSYWPVVSLETSLVMRRPVRRKSPSPRV